MHLLQLRAGNAGLEAAIEILAADVGGDLSTYHRKVLSARAAIVSDDEADV